MSLSTSAAVQEVHRLAVQQDLTRALKGQEDWDRFNAIARHAAETIDLMQANYREHYRDRLKEAREVILREQSAKQHDMPKPSWAKAAPLSPMSPEKLDMLATARVQADHERVIAKIRADEIKAYRVLRAELLVRDQNHGRARAAFNRTNQISPHESQMRRRSGPSRT